MVDIIYVEREIAGHPRVRRIRRRYPRAGVVYCERYTELFNPKAQSFRLQKSNPALILARKHDCRMLDAPPGYGIGADRNYYFSHMLNCVYDCRYCFLQGMFRSAHYVVFVNYEDFAVEIRRAGERLNGASACFFSGYDCDSLAYEPVTGFAGYFLPLFAEIPNAMLELRTKSTQVRKLLARPPPANVVVAFSFTPKPVSDALEHKVPSVTRRIAAMTQLQRAGWRIGLRFDPLIYHPDYAQAFQRLVREIFAQVDADAVHSVTMGTFRMPVSFYKNIVKQYPREPLFAGPFENARGMLGYREEIEHGLMDTCGAIIRQWVDPTRFFAQPVQKT